ncbi:MAG: hypothetical protein AB1689_08065 [Thermodesulfobacteriota bacterium]
MSALAGALYRGVARAVALGFARLGFVRSVYVRRSVACGEAVLPRSDLDLTIVVEPAADLEQEVTRMRALARRLATMRRLVPVLGAAEVATRAELELWYRSPWFPGSAERDRGWLRLWGDEMARPAVDAPAHEAWRQNLPWFFWAWQSLPSYVRARRVRACCNLVLDMLNVAWLGQGIVRGPVRRADLLDAWAARGGDEAALARLRAVLRGRAPVNAGALLRWLYRQSLRIAHELPDDAREPAFTTAHGRVATRVPFSYAARTYLLVDLDDDVAVDTALDAMLAGPSVAVTTPRALWRYLRERNPWEWWCIEDAEQRARLAAPSDEALLRAIRYYAHPIPLRRLGLAIGTGVDRRDTIAPQYAQARLWLDRGVVATGRDALGVAWRESYEAWPYPQAATTDAFFARCYAILRRDVDELARRTGIAFPAVEGGLLGAAAHGRCRPDFA